MSEPSSATGDAIVVSGGPPRAYLAAGEVRTRARVTERSDSPALSKALSRLDRVLASGRLPSAEVPRGYYINIRV